jgi:cytoskeletal protein RodZ
VPFSKRKSGRGPFQRLSDSRRSVVLGGLAIGAVFSAAVLRRKRRGGEAEFEGPVAPSAQPDFGPPAAVDVPLPASAPEASEPLPEPVDTAEAAVAAGPTDDATQTPINAATEATPAEAESPVNSEPATGELSAEEASVLSVLAQNGRADDDRTTIAVATSLERETTDVASVLRKLGAEGVVSGDLYTATGDKIWAVTERGVRRLGAQH